MLDVQEMLGHYCDELRATGQDEESDRVSALAMAAEESFLMSIPEQQQTDPSVSTE